MPRLLIADGDANLRDFLQEELTYAGFSVVTVCNGAEVIDAIAEPTFDVILLDLSLPGMDGIELIKTLKKTGPNIPILGLTGYVGRGYIAQALELGVSTLTKPVIISNLIEEINAAQTRCNKKSADDLH